MIQYNKSTFSTSSTNTKFDSLKVQKPCPLTKDFIQTSPTPKRRHRKNSSNISMKLRDSAKTPDFSKIYRFESYLVSDTLKQKFLMNTNIKKPKRTRQKNLSVIYRTYDSTDGRESAEGCERKKANTSFGDQVKKEKSSYEAVKEEMHKKNYAGALDLLEKAAKYTKNKETIYLKGVCNMYLGNYKKAIDDFEFLASSSKTITENLYMNIYNCHISLKDHESALKTLNSCIKHFPSHTQAYFMRGKLLLKLRHFDLALKDFKSFNYPQSSLYISLCWKGKKHYSAAKKYLEKYKTHAKTLDRYYLELGKLEYRFHSYRASLQALNLCKAYDIENAYYLSKCKNSLEEFIDAELLLEKVAQNKENEDLADKAIIRLSCIKLRNGDFYGAYNYIKRLRGEIVSPKKLIHYKHIEAMYSIVQNNFVDAVNILTELLGIKGLEFQQRCFLYRGFAYFCLKKFSIAACDYQKAEEFGEIDKASVYNFMVSLAMSEYCSTNFDTALELLPHDKFENYTNPMWQIIRVHCLLYKSSDKDYDISDASQELKSIKKPKKDKEFFFLASLCNYFERKFEVSFEQVNRSIELAEKSSFLCLALRGFCHIALKNYQEAFDDFSASLNINKHLKSLFPYRGLCAFFSGDEKTAIKDFVKISKLKDPNAPLLSLYLLMVCQSPDDALELISKIPNSPEINLIKAHCFLLQAKYDDCLTCLEDIDCLDTSNDIVIIRSLKNGLCHTSGPGIIFNEKYALWIEALEKVYNKQYEYANDLFELIFSVISSSDDDLAFNDNYFIEEERCEILYNMALCNIMQKSKKGLIKAQKIMKEIFIYEENRQCAYFLLLSAIINISLEDSTSAQEKLQDIAHFDRELCASFINNDEIHILPLNTKTEFSGLFPLIELPEYPKILCRPSVRLPSLQPPLDFNDTLDVLLNLLKIEGLTVRPEIPWLSKVENKYVFTDTIIDDIESNKSESKISIDIKKRYKSYLIFRDKSKSNSLI